MTKPRQANKKIQSGTECELCGVRMSTLSEWTICGKCDSNLEKQFAREDQARAEKHADKYKCVECGTGLPVSRRFKCLSCIPPWDAPSECQYESIESVDVGDAQNVRNAFPNKGKRRRPDGKVMHPWEIALNG